MASNFAFSVMPSVSISRSRFERKSQHKTSFNMGDIVPIYVDEVLPGDTRSIDLAALVRMSTPIAPIMDNIYIDYFAFFVPNRLVYDNWKKFMGENEVSAGIPSTPHALPYLTLRTSNTSGTANYDSVAAYMGLPLDIFRSITTASKQVKINALPLRGYYLIYNEWFRSESIIAPLAIQKGDNNAVLVSRTVYGTTYYSDVDLPLMKAAKLPDYFTRSLPYAQKSDPIQIPMGNAPIIGDGTLRSLKTEGLKLGVSDGDGGFMVESGALSSDSSGFLGIDGDTSIGDGDQVLATNLLADISSAAGTIDELRYAFQLQKFLWRDAVYGSRYWEILAGHFNITAPDASLQRPEYLGGHRMNINVDQVLSTAGYSNDSSTTVGAPGANSVTGKKTSLFTKSFTEHGFIFIMAVARHDQTYTQGVNKMWLRKDRYDYYWPEFANLGSQAVLKDELYLDQTNQQDRSAVFGYQEAWSEYRYKPSIATGLLNPSRTGSLNYWTLANDFDPLSGDILLSQEFIEQGRNSISRALVTSTTGPDFIADFYFRDIAVRPMPTYSIPGLADHH